MGGRAGEPQIPGDEVPGDGAEQPAQDDVGVDDADIDQAFADRLCHRSAHGERGNEVEERCPDHRDPRSEHPGGNDSGYRVGAVVKTIDEIEDQGDCNDGEDVPNIVSHAQACLMEMDSSTFPASSMWSRVFSRVS